MSGDGLTEILPNTRMPADEATRAAYLDLLRSDFNFFITELWIDRKWSRVAPLGDVERDIAHYAAHGESPDRGILGPRGLGKTHLISIALSLWRLLRDLNRKILITSKSNGEAKKTVGIIRDCLKFVWFLEELNPGDDDLDTATAFTVKGADPNRQPSVSAIGIEGMLEGNRAHTVIADDVETDKNTETHDSRENLDYRVNEFSSVLYEPLPEGVEGHRPIDGPEIVYVGTYHHEDSLYHKLSDRGYEFRTWPIEYPADTEKVLNLAPMLAKRLEDGLAKPGEPTMPLRFDAKYIAKKRLKVGWHYFAMQYKLLADLSKSNRYPLRLADLIVMSVPRRNAPVSVSWATHDNVSSTVIEEMPARGLTGDCLRRPAIVDDQHAPYTGTKAYIDPAGRGDDLTGITIISHLGGMLWMKVCDGLPGGADPDSLDTLAKLCRQHGATWVGVESNIDVFDTFSGQFELACRRLFLEPGMNPEFPEGWRCTVEKRDNRKQKEIRIIGALEPVVSGHRMIVDPSVLAATEERSHDFQYQFSRITKDPGALEEDAKLDSAAGCVKEWMSELGQDPEKAAARAKDRLLEDQERAFKKLRGLPVKEPMWAERY